jgi:uncharacterized protein with FMN-binding domain
MERFMMFADTFIMNFKNVAPALAVLLIVGMTVTSTMQAAIPNLGLDTVFAAETADETPAQPQDKAPIFINKNMKKDEGAGKDDKAPALPASSVDLGECADGTYMGTGYGYAGYITVRVVIKGQKIKSIKIVDAGMEDPPYMAMARKVIGYMLKAQSTDVDTVSGATFSSNGIISAVRDALGKAAGKPSEAPVQAPQKVEKREGHGGADDEPIPEGQKYKDGVYAGVGIGYNGEIHVNVTILNGAISGIDVTKHGEDEPYISDAMKLIGSILSAQSVSVDTVSGATYSSRGILSAVKDALKKAVLVEGDPELSAPEPEYTAPGAETPELSEEDVLLLQQQEEELGQYPDEEPAAGSYMDGTYTGLARGYKSAFKATVVIGNGNIISVAIAHDDDEEYYNQCVGIIDRIIQLQTTSGIDTVSGCTLSSNAILNSVKAALAKAKKPDPPPPAEDENKEGDSNKDEGQAPDPPDSGSGSGQTPEPPDDGDGASGDDQAPEPPDSGNDDSGNGDDDLQKPETPIGKEDDDDAEESAKDGDGHKESEDR